MERCEVWEFKLAEDKKTELLNSLRKISYIMKPDKLVDAMYNERFTISHHEDGDKNNLLNRLYIVNIESIRNAICSCFTPAKVYTSRYNWLEFGGTYESPDGSALYPSCDIYFVITKTDFPHDASVLFDIYKNDDIRSDNSHTDIVTCLKMDDVENRDEYQEKEKFIKDYFCNMPKEQKEGRCIVYDLGCVVVRDKTVQLTDKMILKHYVHNGYSLVAPDGSFRTDEKGYSYIAAEYFANRSFESYWAEVLLRDRQFGDCNKKYNRIIDAYNIDDPNGPGTYTYMFNITYVEALRTNRHLKLTSRDIDKHLYDYIPPSDEGTCALKVNG
ncbi:MAG: hypothetical protein LUD51_03850 [Clostridia bacterium]|nr:hypothetical protein [Clostridia bacterium]